MEDCLDCKSKQLQIDNFVRIIKNSTADVGELLGRISALEAKGKLYDVYTIKDKENVKLDVPPQVDSPPSMQGFSAKFGDGYH